MGLKYASGESSELISGLTTNLESAHSTIESLKSGCQQLTAAVDGNTLSGAAYTAGKGLFQELIIPTITRVTEATDDVKADLSKYSSANDIVSDESLLDEANLKQQIAIKKASKAVVDAASYSIRLQAISNPLVKLADALFDAQNRLNGISDDLQDGIDKLQKKLDKLQAFSSAVSGLFSDSLNNFKIAMQGVTVLNDTTVNSDGTYSLPEGTDKSWFTDFKKKTVNESAMEAELKNMPDNLTEEETELWFSKNISKYGIDFLKTAKTWVSRGYKGLDAYIKYKNGKVFFKGVAITQDAAGVLKWGNKFLYDPTKGLGATTKNLFKPNKFDGTFRTGKEFKDASKIDLAKYNYAKLPNGKIDVKALTRAGVSKFKESVNPANDFKGWKDAGKLGKFGKGLGLFSTGMTITTNFSKYVDLSDGLQTEEATNFVVDTTVDVGSAAAASATGAAFGSLFLPPLGTVVGAAAGIGVSMVINHKYGNPPKSAVDHVKDGAKKVVNGIGNAIGKGLKSVFG
ncbi:MULTISPECIES: T7SS effector LXG polymorphic toxin [unclassified Enterococcus]|uniref:T7SS effector LXG polymorphic toxin n=1 Tax=unclassified Enterococcus TaxID=2608891 RepID=UPI001552FCCB|nr:MULTISPECIES: T7SS effector LXG polymorphic toxin [unclassified Enterococcus]MBS7576311.1 hypothetical protein [Enterococcus sp. MMGLQ5-2]MBS7583544.1 hypothetical protein [Enterococcus sp. MMGLQ5-1]NPD11406.1 hypothetical protein [Enterococcus sp. MMGLQ5-1]NPD36149.1 hypothetical protein [Enterococcus sp. MMGLQ5-2]